MKIKLKGKIEKGATIIEGFPGMGLIGTITTEFLIEHLDAEFMGHFEYDDFPATAAIHKGKLIHPMGVFYDRKNNIVILHTILNSMGLEWKISDAILKLYNQIKADQIICIEGVSSVAELKKVNTYYFSTKEKYADKLKKLKLIPIKESIIVGVTSGILLKSEKEDITCIFAQTTSALPDSKGAANVIEILDKFLGLDVDYKPLLNQAKMFEEKLKSVIAAPKIAKQEDRQQMSYVG